MAFDLASVLADVSNSDTGREQIEYIRLDLIDSDPNNFYQLSEVDKLADNISLCGLQQPLRVRQQSGADKSGRYMIVSGHRRRAAIELLAKDDPERWNEVPCIVSQDVASPALQQLQLIFANSNTRKMSDAEIAEQAERVKKLLYQLKEEEGYEFPGRMRDHVAAVVGASKSKLARLEVIQQKLAAVWQPVWKDGTLAENTAYELSRMPKEYQSLLFKEKSRTGANLKNLYTDDVKKFAERAGAIEKQSCSTFGGDCGNYENKIRKAAVTERWGWFHCDNKCCRDCQELLRCQRACPRLKETINKLKADAKESAKQEAAAKAERDRPSVEKISALWQRFGLAREMSFKDIEDCKKALGIPHLPYDEEETMKLECGEAKISPETKLPFGYSCYLSEISRLIALADLFNCSLDYLLCRTDVKEMAQSGAPVPESDTARNDIEIIPGAWYPVSVEPPVGAEIIMVDKYKCVSDDTYLGAGSLKDNIVMEWREAVLWALLPKKATAAKLPEASADGWVPLQWLPGQETPQTNLRALAKFNMQDGYPPVEVTAYWRGENWQFKDGIVIDGQCLGWFPLPPKESTPTQALNSGCKTGMSPSGHCGAAAYCSEPVDCCLNCDKKCNGRCGWTEVV